MLLLLALSSAARADAWQDTLDRVVPAVVSIRVSATRAFETAPASTSVATGFVVDAEKGILLTNRHVLGPGPGVAEAIFQDNEEVPLRALYRDPVHDFAFFRFDPADVRFMDVVALELSAQGARVGAEIRIVGSDAGEKISILPGILALLDRPAPNYGPKTYNDFDTFYFQAASGTSGGSSGSPVVDARGKVVALNAGSRRQGASSYFLPLDRVERALALLREGRPVPRGTLQTTFTYAAYDEVRRLGVRPETEARLRQAFPEAKGMLVVDRVAPGGPAAGVLEPGDVLVTLEGALVDAFVPLDAALDDRVGGSVRLGVERGGRALDLALPVGDLHAITPIEYLEFGGALLHPLSYQQARNHNVEVQGVVVASDGYVFSAAGVPAGALLREVGGRAVSTLDEVESALASFPDRERVPVRFADLDELNREQVAVITVDRRWYPMHRCREDSGGRWPCRPSPPAPAASAPPAARTDPLPGDDRPSRRLAPSLVQVAFNTPFRVEGVYGNNFRGAGLVVDTERGWVVVDRDTVPVAMGDLTLTFGASVQVPGRVVWLHPEHNLAVVAYDPARIDGTPVRAARLDPRPLERGDRTWHVGLSFDQQIVSRRTRVAGVGPSHVPLPDPPFFRPVNVETIDPGEVAQSMGGVLTDRRGRVRALWASFVDLSGKEPAATFEGIPAAHVVEALDALRAGTADPWPTAGFEMAPLAIVEARNRGLADESARRLEAHDPSRRQVLEVVRRTAGAPAWELLRDGDLVLMADGAPVTRFREVEERLRDGAARLRVLRGGAEIDVELPVLPVSGAGVSRVVTWAGTVLHETHAAVAAQRGIPPEGVYAAWYWYGSPAARYGLRATRRIVAVDGVPTADLDAFLDAVAGRADGAPVRLATVDLDGKPEVITLKLDLQYWPTSELVLEEGGWTRRDLPGDP